MSFPFFGICRDPSKIGNVNSSQTFYVYGRKEIQSPTRFETEKPDSQNGSVVEHSLKSGVNHCSNSLALGGRDGTFLEVWYVYR
jgi:hypothetical protein